MGTALFDSGSSRLHVAWWDDGSLTGTVAAPYPDSPGQLRRLIADLLGRGDPELVAACSVSSVWRKPLFTMLREQAPGRFVVARNAADLGVSVAYDDPETYGIDRALAAYGAYQIFRDACVVVDAGTALTIDAVGSDGTVLGGYIFPGMNMLAGALSSRTDLPKIMAHDSGEKLGHSTVSCIANGITGGFSAAVNRLVSLAREMAGSGSMVVVTGGGADMVRQFLHVPIEYRPHLVLEGLGMISHRLPAYE